MNTENRQKLVLLQKSGAPEPIGPAEMLARWPTGLPLAAFCAGRLSGPSADATPRWTILASPDELKPINEPADLDQLLANRESHAAQPADGQRDDAQPPFKRGRLIMLSYGLGAALESSSSLASPTEAVTAAQQSAPLGWVIECPAVLAFDAASGTWSRHGDPDAAASLPDPEAIDSIKNQDFWIGDLATAKSEAEYLAIVRTGLDLIGAGDVYQVNLAHRLQADFEGSPRALAAALFETAAPMHGFYAEISHAQHETEHICSVSPELFLSFDPATRIVQSRPMKGTRSISGDAEELRHSEKDRAELNMITDLMRNDLGRVCHFGSMRVEHARSIESHGRSVWQATSTVSGVLRNELSMADLVRATFPPGSVTGAPKIRAMQIIAELEATQRGFYCGALGWLDDSGAMSLNVAIRTATITGTQLSYHAGAGIVADSDPHSEWAETAEKTEILRRLRD